MSWVPPPTFICCNCGRERPVREEERFCEIDVTYAIGLTCSYCASITFVQLAEEAATSPPADLPQGPPSGASACSPLPPLESAAAPVPHNCEECGSGWQRDYSGSQWGRCFALDMRTPARGAGCRNNWRPKEAHGKK